MSANNFDKIAEEKYSKEAIVLWNHFFTKSVTMGHAAIELDVKDDVIINEAKRIHRHWKSWMEINHNVDWDFCSGVSTIEDKPLSEYGKKKTKKKPVRVKVFGYSVTSVLRWMGANGWEFDDAALAIETISENYDISDWTIKLQLKQGAKMADPKDLNTLNRKAKMAPITPEQAKTLEEATK